MILLKTSKITFWLTCLLFCLYHINLKSQQNLEAADTGVVTESEFPKTLSCTCESSLENCTGIIIWDDGSRYEGTFRYGKLHGKGKLTLSDNCSYEGDFNDETFEGQGTMIYEDGSKYIGNWAQGYREGEGVFLFPDGREYIGEFEMDQFDGEGAIVLSSGEIYSGTWDNGEMQGFGTTTRLDGSKYIGMGNNGTRNGPGMVVWESGDTLYGNWQEGKMAEEGTFQFSDGSTMISFWEDGLMQKENIYIKSDGERFSAPANELPEQVLTASWDDSANIERNFGMAFYSIGMEYKSMTDFDRAKEYLNYAAEFSDFDDHLQIKNMVKTQLANINLESEKNSGVAKKKEDNH